MQINTFAGSSDDVPSSKYLIVVSIDFISNVKYTCEIFYTARYEHNSFLQKVYFNCGLLVKCWEMIGRQGLKYKTETSLQKVAVLSSLKRSAQMM